MKILINIFFLIIFISLNISASESINNIIFKVKNNVYTKFDIERRINYFEIINNINYLDLSDNDKKELINNYISSIIFNEYNIKYKIIKGDINNEIENIYNSIINKETKEFEKIYIKNNIKIDLIRKKILEKFLSNNKKELIKESNNLDILYNYNLKYLIFKSKKIDSNILDNILNREDFLNFEKFLIKNNINFITKSEDLNDIKIIAKSLNKIILEENNKIIVNQNNGYTTLYSIEKNLESYEGLFVKLINYNSDQPLNKNNLNCRYVNENKNKTEYKEYEYSKLNNQIKNNLKAVNDFILIKNNEIYNYIFLCELKFDKELFNSINFNKKLYSLLIKIENKFLTKYKKEFKFAKFDE